MIKDNALTIFLILLLLSGCGGKNTKLNEPIIAEEQQAFENITSHYYLQPGDVINITFLQNPELNETVPVRPDGRISLQLIDEVEVAGLKPPQVQELLNEKYTPYLKKPMATVFIKSFGGQKVYVGGQVNTPGVITIGGRTTVAQAIFDAGGLRSDANISDIIIISRGPDGEPISRDIHLRKALKGNLPEREILIRPYDIIYVPKSTIVKGNEFIQHVYNFIPPNLWFGFSYDTGWGKTDRTTRDEDYTPPPSPPEISLDQQ